MNIKNILLILLFSLTQYNCYAVDHELNYYTNRVAQSLYAGSNVNLNEVQNICEEIKTLKNTKENSSKINNDINKETLESYKEILTEILNYNQEKYDHKSSIDSFINIIDKFKLEYNNEIIGDTFLSVLEKLS